MIIPSLAAVWPTRPLALGLAALSFAFAAPLPPAHAVPLYDVGETGFFGNFETLRAYNVPILSSGGGDSAQASFRFTAASDVSFNEFTARITLGSFATEDLIIDVVEDNGGAPTGNVIASTNLAVNDGGAALRTATFGSSVNLNAGQIYHINVRGDGNNSTTGNNFGLSLWASVAAPSQTQPFDNFLDPAAEITRFINGSSYQTIANRDPVFVLSNNGTPTQGSHFDVYQNSPAASTAGAGFGQYFRISENEAPAGTVVNTDNVSLNISSYTSSKDLVVHIREVIDDDNDVTVIVASGVLQASDFTSAGWYEIMLDSAISLSQDKLYLITTEFAGGYDGAADGAVGFFGSFGTGPIGGTTAGGYGGVELTLAQSGGGQNWASIGQILDRDLHFRIEGTVALIPEPSSLGLVALGAGLMSSRPRRASRLETTQPRSSSIQSPLVE